MGLYNNSFLDFNDIIVNVPGIGGGAAGRTDLINCCNVAQTGGVPLGEWYYPNGQHYTV